MRTGPASDVSPRSIRRFCRSACSNRHPGSQGRQNPLYAHHSRTYFDIVATHKWTDKLTQASEAFFIIDPKVPFPNHTVKDTAWYGFANWFLYTFDTAQKYTGVWRAEIFNDPQGAATGAAGLYDEMTIGLDLQAQALALGSARGPV